MLTLSLSLIAVVLAFLGGARWGREAERRLWTSNRLAPERRVAFENSLRASRGLRKLHPDPENAPRVSRARVRRRQ